MLISCNFYSYHLYNHSLNCIQRFHLTFSFKFIWDHNHNIYMFLPAICTADYLFVTLFSHQSSLIHLSINIILLFYQPSFYEAAPATNGRLSASRDQVLTWTHTLRVPCRNSASGWPTDGVEDSFCRPPAGCIFSLSPATPVGSHDWNLHTDKPRETLCASYGVAYYDNHVTGDSFYFIIKESAFHDSYHLMRSVAVQYMIESV